MVGLGIDNAFQYRVVLLDCVLGYFLVQLLHDFRLLPNDSWLQNRLDYLSVEATLLGEAAKQGKTTFLNRIHAHTKYLAAVKDFQ